MKKTILILIVALFLTIIGGCSSKEPTNEIKETGGVASSEDTVNNSSDTSNGSTTDEQLPVFNAEELAKYDGVDGNPAYVAYEGYVYDVSNIKAWKGGIHQGKHKAGFDYTDVLNNEAPHSSKNLTDNAPIVGIYKDE